MGSCSISRFVWVAALGAWALGWGAGSWSARGQEGAIYDREEVIYGRKHGVALTMDVFTPKGERNGLGIAMVVSGGWFSDHAFVNDGLIMPYLKRGYTVFCVVHGSQPKYSIPEIVGDMRRSIRFIRHESARFGVDPDRLGVTGASAGGHLSLMLGMTSDEGDPKAADPVDRESSRVASVACFFPPTDFLNYGKAGENALGRGVLENFRAPFQFTELDRGRNMLVPIEDEDRRIEIGKSISPVYHATADDAPALIVHGDADRLVPIQQAELAVKALRDAGVRAELRTKAGQGHGWPDIIKDVETFADWFDETLKGGS